MTYTHLTPNELVIIEAYFHQKTAVAIVAKQQKRGRQAIYNIYHFLKQGKNDLEYLKQYKKNKKHCGKQAFKRNISEREKDHVDFETEFGHLECDTIVGVHHKSAVITLVERLSKVIIALKPEGRKAANIEEATNT